MNGLLWEIKTNTVGVRYYMDVYTNYDDATRGQKQDGSNPSLSEIQSPTNSVGYINTVNTLQLCGVTGWRIPTSTELQSLINYTSNPVNSSAAVDPAWVPNTWPDFYVSSDAEVGMDSRAWIVDFDFPDRFVLPVPRSSGGRVRAVRTIVPTPTPRFQVIASGSEVLDRSTGLTWRRCLEGMTWSGSTCLGTPILFTLSNAGFHIQSQVGWRFPTAMELGSIVDRSTALPAVDASVFPGVTTETLWTSTPRIIVPNPSPNQDADYFSVGFATGEVNTHLSSDRLALRLVR